MIFGAPPAQPADRPRPSLTATNMTVGTVSYAAPEQLMGAALDGRSDQYALAATATLAGPPAERPAMESGNSIKNRPMPELCMNAPRGEK